MKLKSTFRFLALSVLVIFTTLALSQDGPDPDNELTTQSSGTCSGVLCYQVMVDRLYVATSGATYIATSGDETNGLTGCQEYGGFGGYSVLFNTQKNHKEIYTLLLAAQLSGKQVTIKMTTTGSGKCKVLDARLDLQP